MNPRPLHRTLPALVAAAALPACVTALAADSPAPYWSDSDRGWHFYEEPEHPPVLDPGPATRPPSDPRPPEIRAFERLQRDLEQRRQIAIMRPTEANVRRYMALEAQVVEQASRFSDVAQRVAWTSPELDPSTQGRPTNAKALEVFEEQQKAQRSQALRGLASDHALLFFFRSDCPYCHAFAPTVDALRRQHGLTTLAVSLDGGLLPGFPDARRDNGIASRFQVTQVPALYLAHPASGRITPVAFGMLSESQLLERLSAPAMEGSTPTLAREVGFPSSLRERP